MNETQGYYIEPSKSEIADYARYLRMFQRNVWIVREGMRGGYMPDSLCFFSTKRAAMDYMIDRKREAQDEDYKVTGSARDGYYSLMPSDASDYTLGNNIVLDSVNADMYRANLKGNTFESFGDLVQYLNDHLS